MIPPSTPRLRQELIVILTRSDQERELDGGALVPEEESDPVEEMPTETRVRAVQVDWEIVTTTRRSDIANSNY